MFVNSGYIKNSCILFKEYKCINSTTITKLHISDFTQKQCIRKEMKSNKKYETK